MPKPKSFLKEAKGKKKIKGSEPETADDFLAAGVELEEAGEKWRAGDAVKSMRFFMRAIEAYDNGLSKYSTSFDLAYNKARVQYEITQHPKLASQLPAPLVDILHITLKSHRDALSIQQDNADILFNTAQVLTSLADAITEGKRPDEHHTHEALKYLQEALDLFQRCLSLQEFRFTELQEQIKMMESGTFDQEVQQTAGADTDGSGSQASEQWASVIEPVTKDTLIDTAVAQLETLATLCGLLGSDHGSTLAWIEEYSADLLREKIAAYAEGTTRKKEVAIARAKFISTLTEVSYRSGRIDLETYKNELSGAFGEVADLAENSVALCSQAEALISFNSAVAEIAHFHKPENINNTLSLRWQALSSALDSLTTASKLPNAENVSKIHLARGDTEMHRWQLGLPPCNYAPSQGNAATLLNNAQTYYRGGAAIGRRDGLGDDEKEGVMKEAVAKALAGDMTKMEELVASAKQELTHIAGDMVEDGLVPTEDMDNLFRKADPDEIVF